MAIHSVRPAHRQPLGIPVQYLLDQVHRGAVECSGSLTPLVREYDDATGHTFAWGQLIEQRLGEQTLWRVMPVALWDGLEPARQGSELTIWELTASLQGVVREHLEGELPPALVLTGLQDGTRRSPHSLFSLLCTEEHGVEESRDWLERHLLPRLLPVLLDTCEAKLSMLLTVAHGRAKTARALIGMLAQPEASRT